MPTVSWNIIDNRSLRPTAYSDDFRTLRQATEYLPHFISTEHDDDDSEDSVAPDHVRAFPSALLHAMCR